MSKYIIHLVYYRLLTMRQTAKNMVAAFEQDIRNIEAEPDSNVKEAKLRIFREIVYSLRPYLVNKNDTLHH